jgi:hypothetical protein
VPDRKSRRGYWNDKGNQKAFFDRLASKLNIQKLEDWNIVTLSQVVEEGGSFVTYHYNSSVKQGKECLTMTNLGKHYKQFTLNMSQIADLLAIGKTNNIRKRSLMPWLSN